MLIRLAQDSDLRILCNLDSVTDVSQWNLQHYQQAFKNEHYISFIIYNQQQILGCIIYSVVLDEAEIIRFFIACDHQSQGYGMYLLRNTLAIINDKHNVQQIFLEVNENNYKAIQCYQKNGFIITGVRKNYYMSNNQLFNALIMVKKYV
jgi:ribosomal-protein-alanine N-acetyltransferase